MTTSTSGAQLGAYRNLTDKFIRFRDQARGNFGFATSERQSEAASTRLLEAALGSSSSMGLGHGEEGSGLEGLSATLPPAWVDFSEEVSADINRIKNKLKELAVAHHKALLPNFDDMGNDKDDHVVEIVTQDITRLFKRCEARLRALNDARGAQQETVIIKNVQRKLATELQKLSQEFRKMQKDYLQRLKQQEGRGPGASGVDDIFGWDAATGGGGGQGLADPGFSQNQMQRLDRAEAVNIERDQEVTKILQSVNDLAGVMKDLSVLVIDQGTILDRIDYNCEQVEITVDEGRKQLVKAETHQKSTRMITCIYFLMVMIGLMTMVVIFQKM